MAEVKEVVITPDSMDELGPMMEAEKIVEAAKVLHASLKTTFTQLAGEKMQEQARSLRDAAGSMTYPGAREEIMDAARAAEDLFADKLSAAYREAFKNVNCMQAFLAKTTSGDRNDD